ncbi:MAG: hypothetical protein ACJAR2_004043 [Ilumatobacter sp.]|jgi:hypothetical protein
MGEGWRDILSLLMTLRGDSSADRMRGVGTYLPRRTAVANWLVER